MPRHAFAVEIPEELRRESAEAVERALRRSIGPQAGTDFGAGLGEVSNGHSGGWGVQAKNAFIQAAPSFIGLGGILFLRELMGVMPEIVTIVVGGVLPIAALSGVAALALHFSGVEFG